MDDSIISIAKLNNGAIKHGLSPKQNHLISVFTSLERTLTDKRKKYFDKVESLIQAWEQIANFVSEASKESPQPFFDFLFLNTLRFVLRADWPTSISTATKTHLSVTLQRFITVLNRCDAYPSILEQCRVLEIIVKDPWGQKDSSDKSALKNILQSEDVDLKLCEEYFKLENGKVVVVRLEMLLLSKCEDIAINLSKACLNTIENFNENLEGFDLLDFTQDEIDYITDIYFSSLFKNKKRHELMTEIKKYQLNDGLELLQRYRKFSVGGRYNEHCKTARVWKNNARIVELLANTLLVNAVLNEDLVESQSQLEELIIEWAACQTVDGVLKPVALEMIRKFVLIAPSSKCIYPFCSFLIRNGNCKEQDFDMVAKCVIRAINQNMNEVEQHRVNRERDKLKETYGQLSQGFLLLSDLLNECQNIYKECLLTSFSLTPTRECLRTIETFVNELATIADPSEEVESEECQKNEPDKSISSANVESPKPVSDDGNTTASKIVSEQCENFSIPPCDISASETSAVADHKPLTAPSSSELNEILESMGLPKNNVDQMQEVFDSKQANKQFHSTKGSSSAYIMELENLKLDETMGGDLNTILSYRRYHTLTWDLEWPELKANCEQYLEDFEKKDFDDVELKYLDLDYNQFKDQPINYDDYGIEKGYEQFAYSASDSEEEVSSTKRSGVSSIESDEDILLIHRKRKKVLSSDSDEPKNKKKRGRKPKPKIEELRRRNSQKSDTGSNPEEDKILDTIDSTIESVIADDKILNTIESVIAESSNAENLKELRSFRITSVKPFDNGTLFNNDNHNDESYYDELNDVLADSCKSLENVEMPPLPRFNIYDIILENTLVPSDSDKRLPKCEDLLFNNENVFRENIAAVEPIKQEKTMKPPAMKPVEKPRKSVAKEKNPNAKKGPPKVHKSKVPRPGNSYLTYSSSLPASHSTLLSNDDLFKRKYGSKPKIAENQPKNNADASTKDLVLQLPKLNETFSQFQKKNNFVMKPIDQNVSFTSYLNNTLDKTSISPSVCVSSSNDTKYNTLPQTLPNDANGSDTIEDIENFLRTYKSPNGTPTQVVNTSTQVFLPQTNIDRLDSTSQTDISGPEAEFMESQYTDIQYLFNVSASAYCAPTPEPVKPSPNQNNIHKVMPTTSKLVSVSSPVANVSSRMVNVSSPMVSRSPVTTVPPYTSNLYNTQYTSNICNNDTAPKTTGAGKVEQILQNYQTAIADNPSLKNVPAPRKRTNAIPRKPRNRANKTDRQTANAKMHNSLKTDTVQTNTSEFMPPPMSQHSQQISPSMQSGNAFPSIDTFYQKNVFYGMSSTKLPPIDASSQVIACSAKQLQHSVSVTPDVRPTQSKSVECVSIRVPNGVNKHVSHNGIESNTLKALLMQESTASTSVTKVEFVRKQLPSNNVVSSRAPSPVANPISYTAQITNGQQISPPMTRIKNNVPRIQNNDARMNAPNITYNSYDSSSQSQKTAQQFRGRDGFTNDFEVRIPRIDFKIDAANFSLNNVPYSSSNKTLTDTRNTSNWRTTRADSSKTNIRASLLPSVVIPVLPINATQAIRNNSLVNMPGNYQMNNFNVTSTVDFTPTNSRNIQVDVNSDMATNNVVNGINHFSPDALYSTNTQNTKNELNFIINDMNDPNGACISIPEESISENYFGNYFSLIHNGAQMNENNLFNNADFYLNENFNST